jgi:hypothetical protein
MNYIYSILYFSIFSIFILSLLISIFKRMNLISEKNLLVRYLEYNKKDNSNAKLLIIFAIFLLIWSLVFLLQ